MPTQSYLDDALATLALEDLPERPSELLSQWQPASGAESIFDEPVARLRRVEAAGVRGRDALRAAGLVLPSRAAAARRLIDVTLRAVLTGRADPVEAAAFVHGTLLPELETPAGRLFASPMRALPNSVGSSCGLEMVFCWLREVWDCRAGIPSLVHGDLPPAESERRLVAYLRESIAKWLGGQRASA
jgi:hypothetical protein